MYQELAHIKSLVRQGENAQIEFKQKVAHPEKIVREVVAFANSDGGHLLIGVSDDGQMPGVKFPEEEEYAMSKAINELVWPLINFQLNVVHLSDYDEKAILHYEIFSGEKKPYYAKEQVGDKYGTAYVRIEDKSVKASKELKEILRRMGNKRGTKFNFGEKEKVLLQYLEEHNTITLSEFQNHAKLSRYMASKKLILLAAANVLGIEPGEKEDKFYMKNIHDLA